MSMMTMMMTMVMTVLMLVMMMLIVLLMVPGSSLRIPCCYWFWCVLLYVCNETKERADL